MAPPQSNIVPTSSNITSCDLTHSVIAVPTDIIAYFLDHLVYRELMESVKPTI